MKHKFDLYYFDSLDAVDPKKINNKSIIVIGEEGKSKIEPHYDLEGKAISGSNNTSILTQLYFVKNNEFLNLKENGKKKGILHTLTESELESLKLNRGKDGQVTFGKKITHIEERLLTKLDKAASKMIFYNQPVTLTLSSDWKTIKISKLDPNKDMHPLLKDLSQSINNSIDLLPLLEQLRNNDDGSIICNVMIEAESAEKKKMHLIHRLNLNELVEKVEQTKFYQSNPDCKKFYTELAKFQTKVEELKQAAVIKPKYQAAANQASELVNTLKANAKSYFSQQTIETYKLFRENSLEAIKKAKPELEKHHDLKEILGNLALAVIGVGVIYAAACVVNKLATGHFLFFPSDSKKKLDALVDGVKEVHGVSRPTLIFHRPK